MGKCSVAMVFALCMGLMGVAWSGEKAFSFTQAPARGDYIGVNLSSYHLGKYLNECQVNRPEVLNEVKTSLEQGKFYRKSTKDQKGTNTKLTVNVTPDYMLRIVTWRNETCEACKGTGSKPLPFGKATSNVQAGIRCLECRGVGYHPNHTTEKFFILSAEDFEDPKEGRKIMADRAYSGAPDDAEKWVKRLVSKNPKARLAACEWLDKNYVKVGVQFQSIMPMLKKARYQESNEKRKIMVWQFWAGKDLPEERDRAFYRIYVNTKSGKVTEKGFYAAQ